MHSVVREATRSHFKTPDRGATMAMLQACDTHAPTEVVNALVDRINHLEYKSHKLWLTFVLAGEVVAHKYAAVADGMDFLSQAVASAVIVQSTKQSVDSLKAHERGMKLLHEWNRMHVLHHVAAANAQAIFNIESLPARLPPPAAAGAPALGVPAARGGSSPQAIPRAAAVPAAPPVRRTSELFTETVCKYDEAESHAKLLNEMLVGGGEAGQLDSEALQEMATHCRLLQRNIAKLINEISQLEGNPNTEGALAKLFEANDTLIKAVQLYDDVASGRARPPPRAAPERPPPRSAPPPAAAQVAEPSPLIDLLDAPAPAPAPAPAGKNLTANEIDLLGDNLSLSPPVGAPAPAAALPVDPFQVSPPPASFMQPGPSSSAMPVPSTFHSPMGASPPVPAPMAAQMTPPGPGLAMSPSNPFGGAAGGGFGDPAPAAMPAAQAQASPSAPASAGMTRQRSSSASPFGDIITQTKAEAFDAAMTVSPVGSPIGSPAAGTPQPAPAPAAAAAPAAKDEAWDQFFASRSEQ